MRRPPDENTRSQTDLPGYLRSDGECLASRLQEWFTALAPESPPVVLKIAFQESNATSWTPIMDGERDQMVIETPVLGAVGNILDKIEGMVTRQIGSTPFGRLRTIGYCKGNSTRNGLTFQRTLLPGDMAGVLSPDTRLLLQMLQTAEARNVVLHNTVITVVQQLAASNGIKDQTIAALATARTPATAASDLQSFGTLIALAGLIVFSPQIKSAMGLPSNATFADIVAQARKALSLASGAQAEGFRMEADEMTPPKQLEDRVEVTVEGQRATRPAPVPAGANGAGPIDLEAVKRTLDALAKDPELRASAARYAVRAPGAEDLTDALKMAVMEHAMGMPAEGTP